MSETDKQHELCGEREELTDVCMDVCINRTNMTDSLTYVHMYRALDHRNRGSI